MSAAAKLNAQMVDLLSTVFERCWACGLESWSANDIPAGGGIGGVVTVPGARLGDPAILGLTSLTTQVIITIVNVSAANTVAYFFYNPTVAPIAIGNGTLTACVRVRYAI